jgi:hypothetical protein
MSERFSLEGKCNMLKRELRRNLTRKYSLEQSINRQFEELKKVEISLERLEMVSRRTIENCSCCSAEIVPEPATS